MTLQVWISCWTDRPTDRPTGRPPWEAWPPNWCSHKPPTRYFGLGDPPLTGADSFINFRQVFGYGLPSFHLYPTFLSNDRGATEDRLSLHQYIRNAGQHVCKANPLSRVKTERHVEHLPAYLPADHLNLIRKQKDDQVNWTNIGK